MSLLLYAEELEAAFDPAIVKLLSESLSHRELWRHNSFHVIIQEARA